MDAVSVSIMQDPRFDREDFLSRWKRARVDGLRSLFPEGAPVDLGEEELLARSGEFDTQLLLRRVFDQSRKFGLSASRFLGLTFEISDLVEILGSATPCVGGQWKKHNAAYVLERPGCASFRSLGPIACDYWREALDGLVMGVGENERFTRHRSAGHGDSECVDILFREEFAVPRVAKSDGGAETRQSPKYGKLSDEMTEKMESLVVRFKRMKIDLVLAGLSEGTLYYRLDPEKGVLCGAAGKLMHDTFVRDARILYPDLKVLDVAPLAVYGGAT